MRGEGLGEGGSAGMARALLATLPRPLPGLPLPRILRPQDPPVLRAALSWEAGGLGATTPAKPLRFKGLRGGGASETPARPWHRCACERSGPPAPARGSGGVAVTQGAVPGRRPPWCAGLVGAETISPLPLSPGLAVCNVCRRARREPEGHTSVFHSRALGPRACPPHSHPAPVGIAWHTARRWHTAPGLWAA